MIVTNSRVPLRWWSTIEANTFHLLRRTVNPSLQPWGIVKHCYRGLIDVPCLTTSRTSRQICYCIRQRWILLPYPNLFQFVRIIYIERRDNENILGDIDFYKYPIKYVLSITRSSYLSV